MQVIGIAVDTGSKSAGQSVLEVCAGLACLSQAWPAAARFYGIAEAQADYTGIRRDAADEAFLRPLVQTARDALGAKEFASAVAAGRRLGYDKAIDEAKSWLREHG
jgi:hypothetical protein